jgi:hypothetical protein
VNKSLEFYVREAPTFGQLTVAAGGVPAPTVVINTDWAGNDAAGTSAAAQCREAGLSTFIYAEVPAVPGRLRPQDMVATLRAAVARLHAEPDVDEQLIGVLAIGPVAGGVALVAAADDPWIRAVCVRDALLDGAQWLREVSGLDDAGWRRVADDAVRRLQGVTVDGRGGDLLRFPEARPPGLPDEIELATFDHLLRLRPRECAARIPAAQLRMTVSAPASVDASEVRQDAEWLRKSLQFSPYQVTVQT